jgi:chromosome segregation ATPase
MDKSEREIAREYERQTEKLELLAKELQIQRDEKTIKAKRGEMNVLQDNLKTITDDINALEKTRDQTGKVSWRWRSCFNLRRTAQQTLELRGVN